MAKAIDVANFFIDLAYKVSFLEPLRMTFMTNLRINKMLYFAQLYSLARLKKPLFPEDFLAWDYGPVIEDIYHKFKSYGSNQITTVSEDYSPDVFSDEEIALLLDVERKYRQYSTWGLVHITHKEGPWEKARDNQDIVISMESLKDYASQLPPLPKFNVLRDAEGHLVLPNDEDDDDEELNE